MIEKENEALAGELVDPVNLANKITFYSKFLVTHDLFLSEKTLIFISRIEGTIEEFFQEKQDVFFLEEIDYAEFKTAFKAPYVIKSLGYDDNQAIDDLLEKFRAIESDINVPLDAIAYDFKEYQRKNERNTRADQKKGEVVKDSIPAITISEGVVNNLKSRLNGE